MPDKITWGICALIMIITCFAYFFINAISRKNKTDDNTVDATKHEEKTNYEKPCSKPLTQEQIDDIHAKRKITPAEKVKEWEDMGLCAPGDAVGSAAWRCEKFKNCHDCLVDYTSDHDEYTSLHDALKLCSLHDDKTIPEKLDDIKIIDKYRLRHLEVYKEGYLAGYIQGFLRSDDEHHPFEEYEVLYRIHDTDNGDDYTLVSVDYGWKIGDDEVIKLVEEKLTNEVKKYSIDFSLLEKAQAEYKTHM